MLNNAKWKTVQLFGLDIDCLTMDESLDKACEFIRNRTACQHVVLNASKMVAMQRDGGLREIVASCGMVNADGQSVVWASRLLGKPLPERVAGIDLMEKLLTLSEKEGYSVFFLGAEPDVIESFVEVVQAKHPMLKISGYHHGYFADADSPEIVSKIRSSDAEILFLGMSSPKKEYWLAQHLDELGVPFCMGVGGSFDVWAGKTRRAPIFVQQAGLEWLFRLLQEPGRMWKRYLLGNASFAWLVMKEFWRERILRGTEGDTMHEESRYS